MKQLTCDLCGSTDLVKNDGVFVCQSCGSKYSVEEAKRMIIEGEISIKGEVKIDNSKKFENLSILAYRALEVADYENAYKYFSEILTNDTDNWEALYFSVFSRSSLTNIANIGSSIRSLTNIYENTFYLLNLSNPSITDLVTSINTIKNYSLVLLKTLGSTSETFEKKYQSNDTATTHRNVIYDIDENLEVLMLQIKKNYILNTNSIIFNDDESFTFVVNSFIEIGLVRIENLQQLNSLLKSQSRVKSLENNQKIIEIVKNLIRSVVPDYKF